MFVIGSEAGILRSLLLSYSRNVCAAAPSLVSINIVVWFVRVARVTIVVWYGTAKIEVVIPTVAFVANSVLRISVVVFVVTVVRRPVAA